MKNLLLYKIPALLWAAFIFLLLTVPSSSLPTVHIVDIDKLAHAGVFFIQAFLLYRAFEFPKPIHLIGSIKPAYSASIITVIYATMSEVYQFFIPDRTPEILDALANSFGVILFLGMLFIWNRRMKKRDQTSA